VLSGKHINLDKSEAYRYTNLAHGGKEKTSNTWVNHNNKSGNNVQSSAMLTKSNSQGIGNISWILNSDASFYMIGESQNMQQLNYMMVLSKYL